MSPSSPTRTVPTAIDAACARSLQLLGAGSPLHEILASLTVSAEALSPVPAIASILLLDREGLLRNGASPNLPADYLTAIDRLRPHPEVGTCAAAAAKGEDVVTTSFMHDGKWAELRHLPLSIGLRSAWSTPIKATDGRVLGTFGTYFRDEREPSADEQLCIRRLAQVAAKAIEAQGSVAA